MSSAPLPRRLKLAKALGRQNSRTRWLEVNRPPAGGDDQVPELLYTAAREQDALVVGNTADGTYPTTADLIIRSDGYVCFPDGGFATTIGPEANPDGPYYGTLFGPTFHQGDGLALYHDSFGGTAYGGGHHLDIFDDVFKPDPTGALYLNLTSSHGHVPAGQEMAFYGSIRTQNGPPGIFDGSIQAAFINFADYNFLGSNGFAGLYLLGEGGAVPKSDGQLLLIGDGTADQWAIDVFSNVISDDIFIVDYAGGVRIPHMPTSAAGLPAGSLWNNSGVVNIV